MSRYDEILKEHAAALAAERAGKVRKMTDDEKRKLSPDLEDEEVHDKFKSFKSAVQHIMDEEKVTRAVAMPKARKRFPALYRKAYPRDLLSGAKDPLAGIPDAAENVRDPLAAKPSLVPVAKAKAAHSEFQAKVQDQRSRFGLSYTAAFQKVRQAEPVLYATMQAAAAVVEPNDGPLEKSADVKKSWRETVSAIAARDGCNQQDAMAKARAEEPKLYAQLQSQAA